MREVELTMSEIVLAHATADVMLYEDSAKQWVRPGENGALTTINNSGAPDVQKLSNIQLLQGQNKTLFRIVAKRIFDGKTLIEQTIFQKLKYQAATKCFHQWRNEHRQVFGLSFSSEQDAERFLVMVQQALDYVASLNDHYSVAGNGNANNNNAANNINGNGCYQEALYYQQQQQQSANHYNDPDQESVSSAGNGASINNNGYRKSSYSASVMNGMNAMPSASSAGVAQSQQQAQFSQYQQQQQQQQHAANIQRRASQGSNNSSSTNSSTGLPNVGGGNGIYATANAPNAGHPALMGVNRLNITGPPGNPQVSLLPVAQTSSTETALSSCSAASSAAPVPPAPAIPPISNNAPPPPPPPPPSFKVGGAKTMNLADQIKATKLRNSSSNAANGTNRTSNSTTDTAAAANKSNTNGGQSEWLSELAAKIMSRNNSEAKSSGSSETADKRPNGGETAPACRPWQKPNNVAPASANSAPNGSNGAVDSPRIQRKVTSGASLCSQDEAAKNNGSASSSTSVAAITLGDLERFKHELILELNKTKQEILDAVRQELAQFQAK